MAVAQSPHFWSRRDQSVTAILTCLLVFPVLTAVQGDSGRSTALAPTSVSSAESTRVPPQAETAAKQKHHNASGGNWTLEATRLPKLPVSFSSSSTPEPQDFQTRPNLSYHTAGIGSSGDYLLRKSIWDISQMCHPQTEALASLCEGPMMSCRNKCGQPAGADSVCYCDTKCESYGDCCSDFFDVCKSTKIYFPAVSQCLPNGFTVFDKCRGDDVKTPDASFDVDGQVVTDPLDNYHYLNRDVFKCVRGPGNLSNLTLWRPVIRAYSPLPVRMVEVILNRKQYTSTSPKTEITLPSRYGDDEKEARGPEIVYMPPNDVAYTGKSYLFGQRSRPPFSPRACKRNLQSFVTDCNRSYTCSLFHITGIKHVCLALKNSRARHGGHEMDSLGSPEAEPDADQNPKAGHGHAARSGRWNTLQDQSQLQEFPAAAEEIGDVVMSTLAAPSAHTEGDYFGTPIDIAELLSGNHLNHPEGTHESFVTPQDDFVIPQNGSMTPHDMSTKMATTESQSYGSDNCKGELVDHKESTPHYFSISTVNREAPEIRIVALDDIWNLSWHTLVCRKQPVVPASVARSQKDDGNKTNSPDKQTISRDVEERIQGRAALTLKMWSCSSVRCMAGMFIVADQCLKPGMVTASFDLSSTTVDSAVQDLATAVTRSIMQHEGMVLFRLGNRVFGEDEGPPQLVLHFQVNIVKDRDTGNELLMSRTVWRDAAKFLGQKGMPGQIKLCYIFNPAKPQADEVLRRCNWITAQTINSNRTDNSSHMFTHFKAGAFLRTLKHPAAELEAPGNCSTATNVSAPCETAQKAGGAPAREEGPRSGAALPDLCQRLSVLSLSLSAIVVAMISNKCYKEE